MGLLGFWKRRRDARRAAQTASEISERCFSVVMDRVRRRATSMRLAEARGYVRARALELVHREFAALHQGKIKFDPAMQTAIIGQATDAVVVRVLAELRSVPKAAPRAKQRAA